MSDTGNMDLEQAIAIARRPWQHDNAERAAAYRYLNTYEAHCPCGCSDEIGADQHDVAFALAKLVAHNIMCTLADTLAELRKGN